MDVTSILSEIDAQIASLQQARLAILRLNETGAAKPRRGRPKGSTNAVKAKATKKKRNLTPEGRARIAEAMKKRWAERRKETSKK